MVSLPRATHAAHRVVRAVYRLEDTVPFEFDGHGSDGTRKLCIHIYGIYTFSVLTYFIF